MKNFKAEIPVLFFVEGNKVIAYSPAIDLSTCGDTEEQAKQRFAEASEIFFDELVKMGTLEDVLMECGWRKAKQKHAWLPPLFKSCSTELVKIPIGA